MRLLIGVAMLALVAAPASANLLGNPDWETGALSPWTGDSTLSLNSTINGPGQLPGSSFYGGVQSGGSPALWFEQVVTGLNPAVTYILDGMIAGGVTSSSATAIVKLIGASTDTFTQAWAGGVGWHAFDQLSTQPTAEGQITVRFDVTASAGWSNGTSLFADNMTLTPEPVGLALFGLAALPLLRLRRR